jgi:hypothetical protein
MAEGVAPYIFNLDANAIWKMVVNGMFWPLNPREESPYPPDATQGRPQNRSELLKEEKNLCSCRDSNHDTWHIVLILNPV